jgi:hypothetical protein
MAILVIFFLFLTRTLGQETCVNYGAHFREVGRLTSGTETWQHTFQLLMPSHRTVPLDTLSCKGVRREENCYMYNSVIFAYNERISRMQEVL